MSERPWSRHYHDAWLSRAGDPRLPYWLRVTALAYGSHENNGHARFRRGEVGLILGSPNKTTGEIVPLHRSSVHRAIGEAVTYGWLEEGSFARCLIVPAHSIRRGSLKDPVKACPIHIKRGRTSTLSDDVRPVVHAMSVDVSAKRQRSVTTSERAPLSSVLYTDASASDPTHERHAS